MVQNHIGDCLLGGLVHCKHEDKVCLVAAQAVGTPPMLAAIALGQLSNVMGCLSTYGIGSAPPYYGAGYVPQAKWYQLGFLLSIFYITVWLFAGGAWWKVCHPCVPMQIIRCEERPGSEWNARGGVTIESSDP